MKLAPLCAASTVSSRVRIAFLAALTVFGLLVPATAATPYEYKLAGFMSAALQAIITGEFAGRRPSNADAVFDRRICGPRDYDVLRAAANDTAAFDAFHRSCSLVEAKLDETHVHASAYLPGGYCEMLKIAFEAALAERVHAIPRDVPGDGVLIEYKGSRFLGTGRSLARDGQLQAMCQPDGSLRISAPRVRPRK